VGICVAVFEMIKYHKQQYPTNIQLNTEEATGHFDVNAVRPIMNYSLHTEYSYGKRKFTNTSLYGLDEIITSNKNNLQYILIEILIFYKPFLLLNF
jgi:hypothetical protein